VINAFRHQRFLHSKSLRHFGVWKQECDQRLSASKIFALVCAQSPGPQAITDFKVINAFRHQRFLHFSGEAENSSANSDQRLSASKIFALGLSNAASSGGTLRDQRLSASKIFALEDTSRREGKCQVINAFRHQRFLHLVGTHQPEQSVYRVINAFRHQRFLHPGEVGRNFPN